MNDDFQLDRAGVIGSIRAISLELQVFETSLARLRTQINDALLKLERENGGHLEANSATILNDAGLSAASLYADDFPSKSVADGIDAMSCVHDYESEENADWTDVALLTALQPVECVALGVDDLAASGAEEPKAALADEAVGVVQVSVPLDEMPEPSLAADASTLSDVSNEGAAIAEPDVAKAAFDIEPASIPSAAETGIAAASDASNKVVGEAAPHGIETDGTATGSALYESVVFSMPSEPRESPAAGDAGTPIVIAEKAAQIDAKRRRGTVAGSTRSGRSRTWRTGAVAVAAAAAATVIVLLMLPEIQTLVLSL